MHHFSKITWAVLAITACGKGLALIQSAPWLDQQDEILPFSKRFVISLAVALELIVIAIITIRPRTETTLFSIAWLASMFLSYRLVRVIYGMPFSCACFGAFAKLLPINAKGASALATLIALYMLAGSILALLSNRQRPAIHVA